MRPQGKAFRGWRGKVEWAKRMKIVLDRTARRLKNRALFSAWAGWVEFIETRRIEDALTTKEQLAVRVACTPCAGSIGHGGRVHAAAAYPFTLAHKLAVVHAACFAESTQNGQRVRKQ